MRDVGRVATQRYPAEWSFPFAKQWTDVFRNEPWNIESPLAAGLFSLSPDVVAVVEGNCAPFLQGQHCLHMLRHRGHRALDIFIRAFHAQLERVLERYSVRHVAVESVVRAGLICENVRHDSAQN